MIQHHNYENMSLYEILETFSHYQQVSFAFYCAKDVEFLANDQRVIDCNNAVEQWLKGEKVNLITARDNAWNAWCAANDATASAASAAIDAAWHASCAAVSSAVSATSVAYSADTSAVYAAYAKSSNLYPDDETKRIIARTKFCKEYEQIAQNWLSYWNIPNFPKEESDFPIFDFLQDYNLISYLLPKKRKYYYLNLNGFNIKHQNEAELLKEIDTMHIKNILRRIINNDSTS